MKIIFLILTAALINTLLLPLTANAQARKLTRRVVNPDNTLVQPAQPGAPQPVSPPTLAAPVQPHPTQIITNVVPEKTKEQKDEMIRKTIEFQKRRADAGAPSAQYDLGMRYLKGDGVEKDLDIAKKWLTAASTNGNNQATKKLEELNKK